MGEHGMSELRHGSSEAQGVRLWILQHGQEIYIAKCFFEGFIYTVALLWLMTHW